MVAIPLAFPIASAGITGARVAGPYIANLARKYGPTIAKGIFDMMSKKDDDIIDVKEEDLIREERKDVSTGGEDPNEDPNKKNIIFDSAEEVARKLAGQGMSDLVDAGVENLKEKYRDLDKEKQFELEQADPVNLEKRKSPDLTDEQREMAAKNVQLQVDKKRERYQQYTPIILKIFNENPDLKLVSRNPDEETLTTLIQKEIAKKLAEEGLGQVIDKGVEN